jgi:3-hydroxyisobutyrate dehydrogenase
MAAEDFADPLGTVAMMLKDLDTVADVGANAALPMTDAARALMRESCKSGRADQDISTIVLTLAARG